MTIIPRPISVLNKKIVSCRRCPRLVRHRESVARSKRRAYAHEPYWGKPVPGFGSTRARLVLVGLAPGAHGSNRTGRMFTGDASGDFLYPALHRAGLASQAHAHGRSDGLKLVDCYITAAVRCAPPGNRPSPTERSNCRSYLSQELDLLRRKKVLLCLGQIAFEDTQRALQFRLGKFTHAATFEHDGLHVICSYHVSRQNTQTRRLTQKMFDTVLRTARQLSRP